MPLVVGVSFRRVGKVYYFDPGDIQLQEGDFVIAETARGVEFGEVVLEPREVAEEELVAPLKRIVRQATGDDLQREASNRDREAHAYEVCERKIAEHNLPMKLLEAEYAFDGSQVTFSFSADGRIDFRELVKDVAGILRTKVQLHQIGVRDEAKLIGGYGTCGRPLCCATFLSAFDPISMKMAKDQSLFLNPAKFSGSCGKLMCCLRYEHEFYKDAHKRLPAVGAILQLEGGRGKVVDVNVVSGVITVQTEDDVQLHIPASQLKLQGLCRRHGIGCSMSESHCEPLKVDSETCGECSCALGDGDGEAAACGVALAEETPATSVDEPTLETDEPSNGEPSGSPKPDRAQPRAKARESGNDSNPNGKRGGRPWRRRRPGGGNGAPPSGGGERK